VFVADTNVLVYAADRAVAEHTRCRQLVEAWRQQPLPWYTTWGILYEFVRVSTHPRVFRRPWNPADAWAFVAALLDSPGLTVLVETPRHASIAALTLTEIPGLRGNLVYDAHTAILMREHGVRRIYTRDHDFHRFPFVEVVDPLSES
jgi:toxin-antitoxin system PIN domain toxin